MARAPGTVRDAIVEFLNGQGDATLAQIRDAISEKLGAVSPSSVRSYLNLNVPGTFERTGRGRYRLKKKLKKNGSEVRFLTATEGKAQLIPADCFDWLALREPCSIHAVVTDPPYGLVEYTEKEQSKLRKGKGGVWRIPPSFDGHQRAPLPRFTVLDENDRKELHAFFKRLGAALERVLVPGANVVVASNPLLSHIVGSAMSEGGLELRGYIARLTMTMRGGDRPKNAHHEFDGVSVMPRSMWEPWVILRKAPEGRVQDNLRKWKTGGFRRPNKEQPFGDVLRSNPTPRAERKIAPHPSLKPQEFLRRIVRAALPLGQGVVLDPFAGSGSTLAAANAVGYESVGLERDPAYFQMARKAIPALAALHVNHAISPPTQLGGSSGGKATKRLKAHSY
ncbi:MAG TPA: DNA methyltransferase [Pseudolabrys sp.]|nr:DNA methyltransferase [Pseudolabrys sp.]